MLILFQTKFSTGLLSCIASLKQSDWSIHPCKTRSRAAVFMACLT